MRRTATAALLAVLLLSACGGSEPDLAACEDVIRAQFADAMAFGEEPERPAECDGVSDQQLEEMAIRIINEAYRAR